MLYTEDILRSACWRAMTSAHVKRVEMVVCKGDQLQPLGSARGQCSWVLLISLCVLLTTGMVFRTHASEVLMAMARRIRVGMCNVPNLCQTDLTWVTMSDLSM